MNNSVASQSVIRAYQSGDFQGWAGAKNPELCRDEFAMLRDNFADFKISGRSTPRPEQFSHHKVWRKVLNGKDLGIVQLIGDCVAAGAKTATEALSCADILIRGQPERFRPIFVPFYYGTGRVYVGRGQLGNEDGSLGSWMAKAMQAYGALFSDEPGVPDYTAAVAKAWGDPNPKPDLDKWKSFGAKHLVRSAARITTFDEWCDGIANGYAVTIASNRGFDMLPDSRGFHQPKGKWAHQMMGYGYGPDYGLILNQWGDCHGRLRDFF